MCACFFKALFIGEESSRFQDFGFRVCGFRVQGSAFRI